MKENIFEDAYFGKPYKTRDGRKALFISSRIFDDYIFSGTLIEIEVEDDGRGLRYNPNGKIHSINMCKEDNVSSPLDIVSEWQEKINEKRLYKLAEQSNPYPHYDKSDMCVAHSHDGFNEGYIEGYIEGHRKANEK